MNQVISRFTKFFEFCSCPAPTPFPVYLNIYLASKKVFLFSIFYILITTGRINGVKYFPSHIHKMRFIFFLLFINSLTHCIYKFFRGFACPNASAMLIHPAQSQLYNIANIKQSAQQLENLRLRRLLCVIFFKTVGHKQNLS